MKSTNQHNKERLDKRQMEVTLQHKVTVSKHWVIKVNFYLYRVCKQNI